MTSAAYFDYFAALRYPVLLLTDAGEKGNDDERKNTLDAALQFVCTCKCLYLCVCVCKCPYAHIHARANPPNICTIYTNTNIHIHIHNFKRCTYKHTYGALALTCAHKNTSIDRHLHSTHKHTPPVVLQHTVCFSLLADIDLHR